MTVLRLSPAELLEAVRLLQAVDGQPVTGDHLEVQLGLRRRLGERWREHLGRMLRTLERLGLLRRQAERTGSRHERWVHQPGGWLVVGAQVVPGSKMPFPGPERPRVASDAAPPGPTARSRQRGGQAAL